MQYFKRNDKVLLLSPPPPPNTRIATDIAYTDANDSIWFRKKLNEHFTLLAYWNLAGNTKEKKVTL
jgi:hypothetical protein